MIPIWNGRSISCEALAIANNQRYDEDHIPEIMETSGISDAFRYIDNDKNASKPYLAFYPMPDLAFTQCEEFKKIRVKSDILPGSQICYDVADIDVRYYGLTGKVGSREGVASTLFVTSIEPGPDYSDAEVQKWFEGEVNSLQWMNSTRCWCNIASRHGVDNPRFPENNAVQASVRKNERAIEGFEGSSNDGPGTARASNLGRSSRVWSRSWRVFDWSREKCRTSCRDPRCSETSGIRNL